MDLNYIRLLIDHLNTQGVLFDRGLSDIDIEEVESAHAFRFPPDLRKLLQYALPIGERFPNWRKGPRAALRDSLAWPSEGILREVEDHNFWLPAWGIRPDTTAGAVEAVRRRIAAAPILVPIYGHRYIPTTPDEAGNPIFSVVGTDVMYAGCDIASFFATDFGVPCPRWAATSPRPIAFWDDLIA